MRGIVNRLTSEIERTYNIAILIITDDTVREKLRTFVRAPVKGET